MTNDEMRHIATAASIAYASSATAMLGEGRRCKTVESRDELRSVALAYADISRTWGDLARLLDDTRSDPSVFAEPLVLHCAEVAAGFLRRALVPEPPSE